MIIRKRYPIIFLLILFYALMSAPVLKNQPIEVILFGILFLLISLIAVYRVLAGDVKQRLIPMFAFLYYFVYMTMAQLYVLNSTRIDTKQFCKISFIVTFSVLLLMLGSAMGKRLKVRKCKAFYVNRTVLTYYVLLGCSLLMTLLQIRAAGGFSAYLGASYQGKYSSVSTEKMLGGLSRVINPFAYYNLMYISYKENKGLKWTSRAFFVFHILMIYVSGSSLSILYQLIGLCCMQILDNQDSIAQFKMSRKQKQWIKRAVVLLGIGLVVAVLIRFNRSSDSFSFDVLGNAYTLLISTSTFDALYYLNLTISNLSQTWSIGQFIFAFVFWVPRSIVPFKPLELGRIVATTFQNFNSSINGGFAVTPMAEFYYDFGIIGLIVGLFFLGTLIEIIQKAIPIGDKECNRKYALSVELMFMFATVSLPASWTNMGSTMVGIVMFLIIENFINKFRIRR